MTVKGDLALEIDEQGIEVRITITPDPDGGDITPERIQALLGERKVRAGIDAEAIDRAFRALAKKKTEPVTFVAAAGTPPSDGTPEGVTFEETPVPPRLAAAARAALANAPAARGWRSREERVKVQKKVTKKAPLPFLPARQEIVTVLEKRVVREDVPIDPAVVSTGYVAQGAVVARVTPQKPGREGKSVFGRLIPAPRPPQDSFLFLDGVTRSGAEVKASVSGFLRRGDAWCEVLPFRDHVVEVTASPDRSVCRLSVVPGDVDAPPPEAAEVLARAAALGFAADALVDAAEVEVLLGRAISTRTPLAGRSLSRPVGSLVRVTVAPDRMAATLTLRKARGGAAPLAPSAVSEAIRASRVRGFNVEKVRADLRAFFAGAQAELVDYPLVTGTAPKAGSEQKLEWRALFLPGREGEALRAAAAANPAAAAGLASLGEFPLAKVEAVARVKADAEVLRIWPSKGGVPGTDVLGAAIAPPSAGGPEVRLFEGLALRRDVVVATEPGILEKGGDGTRILLRVRPHRDAAFAVVVSPDRMKAEVTFVPAEGGGARITREEARTRIEQAGVRRGIDEKRMAAALDAVAAATPLADHLVAEGRPPRRSETPRITFHARIATGRAVSIRPDGRADYRAQDRLTRVAAGEVIATLVPRDPRVEDGWDVTGTVVPLPPDPQDALQAGAGVREDVQPDGSVRFTAEVQGELRRDGALLTVRPAHDVAGDVDMSRGNVSFPGNVKIAGAVRSGFSVVAGGALDVSGVVEGALLSSGGSITIGQGVKGEGRAILRSRGGIEAAFAEQSVLLAIGDVHLRGPCVRCQVKCNGKLVLDSDRGSLVGGEVRASRGVELHTLGSPGGARTVLSFGQDFLVKDQIERMEKEIGLLEGKIAALDGQMPRFEKAAAGGTPAAAAALEKARGMKRAGLRGLEQRKLKLIALRDRYDEHVDSEVVVRGTVYPGAVLESHGRRWDTSTDKAMITLHFDPAQGRIVEKA